MVDAATSVNSFGGLPELSQKATSEGALIVNQDVRKIYIENILLSWLTPNHFHTCNKKKLIKPLNRNQQQNLWKLNMEIILIVD